MSRVVPAVPLFPGIPGGVELLVLLLILLVLVVPLGLGAMLVIAGISILGGDEDESADDHDETKSR